MRIVCLRIEAGAARRVTSLMEDFLQSALRDMRKHIGYQRLSSGDMASDDDGRAPGQHTPNLIDYISERQRSQVRLRVHYPMILCERASALPVVRARIHLHSEERQDPLPGVLQSFATNIWELSRQLPPFEC